MLAHNELLLELLKVQKAIELLGAALSPETFDTLCGDLVAHHDQVRRRLRTAGWAGELIADHVTAAPADRLRDGSQEHTLAAWQRFVNKGELASDVSPLIAASWKRCWARINPYQKINPVHLNPQHLLSSQVAGFDLISVARPIMEDLYQCIEHSGVVIGLVNSAGCVLDGLGDRDVLLWLDARGLTPGAFLTEDLMGTNAFGLALAERVPVQVIGPEHYLHDLHGVAGAAAPMFDLSGRLLGVLGLTMIVEQYHYFSLGLVTAGARAIEGQRQSDVLLAEQNNQLAQLNTILSTISDGILVWNAGQTLLHVNQPACHILDIPNERLVGKQVSSFLEFPAFIREAVEQRKPLADQEATLSLNRRNVTCLVSLDYVLHQNNVQFIIMTLRTEKQVRNLVTQQVGASAPLTMDDIIGESPQIRRVRTFIRSSAKGRASVMIRGEVGTGKNALANAIHNGSLNRDGPYVVFACASIPTELILPELLGFEEVNDGRRVRSRPSKFELAQGGTLFFQDIDALPLEAQAALLNALEAGIIQRLGSRRPIEIDVRVLACTTAPIEKLIAQGSFRADLYYRLSAFLITLPPLRERPGDIPLVVERILKRLAQQWDLPNLSLEDGALEALRRYNWPGNIRELEAVLGRAAAQVGPTEAITPDLLPGMVRYATRARPEDMEEPIQSLLEVERQAILRTAQLCQGNVTLMAQALDLSRTTLWRRMKEFGIQPRDFKPRPSESPLPALED